MNTVHINSGEIAYCTRPAVIRTVVGVCVAVCVWDPDKARGGMCHFVLPTAGVGQQANANDAAPGAIENLIRRFKVSGSDPVRLRAKVLGGARIGRGSVVSAQRVGAQNVAAALDILKKFSVAVVGKAVGGQVGRRIEFHTATGDLRFRPVRTESAHCSLPPGETNGSVIQKLALQRASLEQWVVLLGSSTGGIETVESVMRGLPPLMPPIVITQHIRPGFSSSFANSLNNMIAPTVHEATDGIDALVGHVYVAPGGFQTKLVEMGDARLMLRVVDAPPVNGFAPSVDYMFGAAALFRRRRVVAALLTGMGVDGAAGLLQLKRAGATTIAQDEASCVVYGMPRRAVELGAVQRATALGLIPNQIVTTIRSDKRPRWVTQGAGPNRKEDADVS